MSPADIVVLAAYLSLAVENVLFRVPSVASTFHLLRRGDERGDAVARAKQRPVAAKLAIFVVPVVIGGLLWSAPFVAVFWPGILRPLFPLPSVATNAVRSCGIASIVLGRTLTLTALAQLRRSSGGLLRAGLYARSRNPALLGLHAFFLGNCLVFPCLGLWLGFLFWTLNMHVRVRIEESWLLERFGDRYRAYRNRVPRYLLL